MQWPAKNKQTNRKLLKSYTRKSKRISITFAHQFLSHLTIAIERTPARVYSHLSACSHWHSIFCNFSLSHTQWFQASIVCTDQKSMGIVNFKRAYYTQTEICQWPGNCYFIEMYAIPKHLLTKVPLPNKTSHTLTHTHIRRKNRKQPKKSYHHTMQHVFFKQ